MHDPPILETNLKENQIKKKELHGPPILDAYLKENQFDENVEKEIRQFMYGIDSENFPETKRRIAIEYPFRRWKIPTEKKIDILRFLPLHIIDALAEQNMPEARTVLGDRFSKVELYIGAYHSDAIKEDTYRFALKEVHGHMLLISKTLDILSAFMKTHEFSRIEVLNYNDVDMLEEPLNQITEEILTHAEQFKKVFLTTVHTWFWKNSAHVVFLNCQYVGLAGSIENDAVKLEPMFPQLKGLGLLHLVIYPKDLTINIHKLEQIDIKDIDNEDDDENIIFSTIIANKGNIHSLSFDPTTLKSLQEIENIKFDRLHTLRIKNPHPDIFAKPPTSKAVKLSKSINELYIEALSSQVFDVNKLAFTTNDLKRLKVGCHSSKHDQLFDFLNRFTHTLKHPLEVISLYGNFTDADLKKAITHIANKAAVTRLEMEFEKRNVEDSDTITGKSIVDAFNGFNPKNSQLKFFQYIGGYNGKATSLDTEMSDQLPDLNKNAIKHGFTCNQIHDKHNDMLVQLQVVHQPQK